MQGRSGIDALHIVSHGAAGAVQLGSFTLNAQSIKNRSDLAAIGQTLMADGDILLYGCDVAANEDGKAFLKALALATLADIAASDDLTGARAKGGDWLLENQYGVIESALPFVNTDRYTGSLATLVVTTNLDSDADASINTDLTADTTDGGGLSLREALHYATDGDIISFAAGLDGQTISLSSDIAVVNGVTFDGDSVGTLTISGSSLTLAGGLTVTNDTSDTVTISSTLAGGTGAITKTGAGNLTLSGTNTYTGTTTLSTGTLTLSGGNAIADSGAVSVTGGTLVLAANETIGTLSSSGGTLTLAGFTLTASGVTLDAGGMGRTSNDTGLLTTSNVTGTAITGTGGDDSITGGTGSDTLVGGDGNDTLTGGSGNATVDTLTGGNGDDVFVYDSHGTLTNSTNAFVDSIDGGAGTDTLLLTPTSTFTFGSSLDWSSRISGIERIAVGATSSTLNMTFNANAYTEGLRTIDLSGDTNASGTGNVILSRITGGGMSVIGSAGTDSIVGGSGNDTLGGGGSNDTINGGIGVDVITGGAGTNSLTGGAGNDIFAGSASDLTGDTVTDLSVGDSIQLAGINNLTAANIRINGSNLEIDTDATTFASPEVVITLSSVPTADFTVTTTNGGADTLFTLVTPNTAPILTNLNGDSLSYSEDAGALVIDQGTAATVSDSESLDFNSGNLTVTISSGKDAAEDQLSFNTGGTVSLSATTAGANVSVGGTIVGTLANNIAVGNDLVVNLNSNATPANVSTLLQAVTYDNTDTGNPTTGARTVRFTVNDGDGGTSGNADVTVTVSGGNDAPTNISLSASTVSTFDSGHATVGTLTPTDVDNSAWTYTITAVKDPSNNAVTNTNGAVFDLGTTGSSDAASAATATLRAISPSTLTAGTYTITVQVNDGGTGGTYSKDLTVTVSSSLVVNVTAIDSNAVSGTYATDASDASGLDLKEALYYANNASGAVSIAFAPTLTGTITLPSTLSVRDGITLQMDSDTDNRTLTIARNDFTLGGALTADVATGDNLTLNSNLADNGSVTSSLTKTGAGTLTLGNIANATNWSGDLTVSAGTVVVDGSASVNPDDKLPSGTITLDGGTLQSSLTGSNASQIINNAIALGSSGGTISIGGGGGNSVVTLLGVVSGSGTLTKTGAAQLVLSGSNSGTWGLDITAGTVLVTDATNLGSGTVTLSGGNFTVTGSGVTLGNNIVASQSATLTNDFAVTLSGVISASGDLTKAGAGLLTLSGDNTYTGATTISAGPVLITHNNALGSTAGTTTVASGATLRIGNGLTVAENLILSGVGVNAAYGALKINEGTGSATVNGNITLAANAAIGAFNSGDQLTLSGVISGAFALTKVGSGTLTLSGANTYSGGTTVSTGTLKGNSASLQGDITNNASVTFDQSSDGNYNGSISGAGAFSKIGSGILTLSGASTYSGATSVAAGTLSVTGTLASNVTVASGAILDGTGTLSGVTTLNGGTLSAGTTTTAGSLSTGNLVLADALAGTLSVQIGGTTAGSQYDQINVTGSVVLTTGTTSATLSTSVINSFVPTEGNSFTLINNDGADAVTGTFNGLAEGATVTLGGQSFQISYAGGTNNNDVILSQPNIAPVFAGATVNGTTLVMTYTELNTLDATNIPATTDFTVMNGTTAVPVNNVVVDAANKTVTLTLATAVTNGASVTVAYTDPSGGNDPNAIQDAVGNDAATLTATAVTNNTPAPAAADPAPSPAPDDNDGIAPEIEAQVPALPNANGTTVTGDGNGDGVADTEQPEVTSVPFLFTPTAVSNPGDAPPVYITLVAGSQTGTANTGATAPAQLTGVTQLDAPLDIPPALNMPLGLISFAATTNNAGATEDFSLFVDGDVPINGYWKQTSSGGWVNIASHIERVGDKLRIDFSIADGGPFDADGQADGVITDPGAFGFGTRSDFSLRDKVIGLYIAYYDRAPDQAGLQYWLDQAGAELSLSEISAGFAEHPRFAQEYDGLSHFQIAGKLYQNVLHRSGDSGGISYWAEQLGSRSLSDVMLDFVVTALTVDLDAMQTNGQISASEYSLAFERQKTLDNLLQASKDFLDLFGENTVPQAAPNQLGTDPAYQAAIAVLANIDNNLATVSNQQAQLLTLVGHADPMAEILALVS